MHTSERTVYRTQKHIDPNDVQTTTPQIVANALYSALTDSKVSDIPNYSKNVIIINSDTKPDEAIQILTKNNIRAAPVKDSDESFMGVLDIRDTLQYTLEHTKTKKTKGQDVSSTFTLRTYAFQRVSADDPLLKALKYLAYGANIVGVEDADHKLIGIITQSMLFKHVTTKWNDIGNDCLLQQMFDSKFIPSSIDSVRYDESAYDTFTKMYKEKRSGLAVVDDNGYLLHNTSATDLKLWRKSDDSVNNKLDESIEDFLIRIRQKSKEMTRYPTASCKLNQTLHHAIGQLVATGYHRIWIVDDRKRPIGVLSLTDIFDFVSQRSRIQSVNYSELDDHQYPTPR